MIFPRLMAKFNEMKHFQNVETLFQRLDILSDRSLDNRTYNARENKNPKDLVLIWDTGASFGLTIFRSDFIDYIEADITVKDVTKTNWVIGIGTTFTNLKMTKGGTYYFLVSLTIYLQQMYVFSLPKHITN